MTAELKRNRNRQAAAAREPKANEGPLYQQMEAMLTALTESNSLELLGEMIEVPNAKAVLSTHQDFFDDRNSAELVDGEFQVLGKVVRVVRSDSEESVNLLRKTAFGSLPSQIFDEIATSMEAVQEQINIGEFTTEIEGPAIQIIPIAIFV